MQKKIIVVATYNFVVTKLYIDGYIILYIHTTQSYFTTFQEYNPGLCLAKVPVLNWKGDNNLIILYLVGKVLTFQIVLNAPLFSTNLGES